MGRDILVSYLQQHQDKSYFGFLSCSRDTIVTSSMLFSASWINLDSSWLSRFLDEAKRLNQDNFTALNEKIKKERLRRADHLKDYWCSIIQECKKKRVLLEYEAERDRIYLALSEVNNKIQMTKVELAEISNEWESKKRLDFSGDIDDDFDEVFSGAAAGNEFDKEIGGDPNEEENNSVPPGAAVGVLGPGGIDENLGRKFNEDNNGVFSGVAVGDGFYEEIGGDPNEEGNNNVSPGGLGPGDLDEDIGNEEDKNSVFSAATVDDEEGNNNVFPGADRPTPSLTRQLNPRNLERVDYNVGPPSRKRHKKPVPQPPPEPSSSPSLHSLSILPLHYLFA
ncbi:hypothetical protein RhiirA1_459747 [Rhizophagus irregularis]|uniref:Uncharacterized protein n=2 Tax=Rhizophagus irregularis TaxID=588596 RepID=A0A2N0RSW7_9GLOM|nr:hypothetical protein RhiirA1_459747 [Rhizophagus irregularis]